MSETSHTEVTTSPKESKPVVDILGDNYQFHWTSIDKLPEILRQGIYSQAFAKRIGDETFISEWEDYSNAHFVYVAMSPTTVYGDFVKGVACIVDLPQMREVHLRIGPSQIVGLVVVDQLPQLYYPTPATVIKSLPGRITKSSVFKKIDQIKHIFESERPRTGSLPIYGISGNLYWPQQILHPQIVEALKKKNEI